MLAPDPHYYLGAISFNTMTHTAARMMEGSPAGLYRVRQPSQNLPHACTQPLTMQDSMNAYSGRRPRRKTATSDIQYTCALHLLSGRRSCHTRSPIIRLSVRHASRQAHHNHRTIIYSSAILSTDPPTPLQPREVYIRKTSRPLRHFTSPSKDLNAFLSGYL